MVSSLGELSKASDCSYFSLFGKRIHKAWLMLVGCCFLQSGTVSIVLGCCGLFFVPICNELGFARSEIASYQSFYWLALILTMPLAGKVLSKCNIRIVTCVCAIMVALATGLMSTYQHVWQWICSGLVFGSFGCCVFHLPLVTLIGNWFEDRVGIAMGIATALSAIAIMFFSPFFQTVIANFGWRMGYVVEAIVILLFTIPWCMFVFVRSPQDIGAQPYRVKIRNRGGGCQNFPASSVLTRSSNDAAQKESVASVAPNNTMGAKSNDTLVRVNSEDNVITGVPAKSALKSIPFVCVFIFAGIAAWIGSGFDSNMPGYIDSIGMDAQFGALVISAVSFGSFCEKLLMGYINDKFGVWWAVGCEIVCVCAGIIGLLFLRQPQLLLVAAALFGVQDSFSSVSLPLIIRKLFGNLDYTQIYSWARVGAGVFGVFAAVSVAASYDFTGSYVPAFIAAMAFCVVIIALLVIANKFKSKLTWETRKVFVDRHDLAQGNTNVE